jgi:hypothetical protein
MVFHKYKLIVVGIPKNASSSLSDVLRNKTDNSHDHRTLIDEYNYNDSDLLSTYTSLAVVRNPYERFFSGVHQIRRDATENNNLTVQEVIEQEIYYKEQRINKVFYTQNQFIYLGKILLVDKIIRYENLHEEWKKFVEEYNKTAEYKIKKVLPFSNTTKDKKHWTEEFKTLTQDQLDLINTMYECDFKLFGYEMIEKI